MSTLILNCGSSPQLTSSYFFVYLSIQNVQLPVADAPPALTSDTSVIPPTNPLNIAQWSFGALCPPPAAGVWSGTTTYGIGDTVSSPGVPWTYKSVRGPNLNHPPQVGGIEVMDGWWTNSCQPPQTLNQLLPKSGFGYIFTDAVPDLTTLTWAASLGNSIFWNVTPPGDIVYVADVGVRLNYSDGTKVDLRAQSFVTNPGTQGEIVAPTTSSGEFHCWHTSGLSSPPNLILSNWQPIPKSFDGTPVVGSPYSSTMVPAGGTPPYTFRLIAGALPRGTTLNPSTGVISGTLLDVGTFTFTIQVTDSLGATAEVTCGIGTGCGGGSGKRGNAQY